MDFRFMALSLRGSEATEAIHKKVDSSMDRHATAGAVSRDDRESNNSSPTTQAAVFSSDFWGFLKKHRLAPSGVPCFQAVGEGILLGVNEQARAVESTKSAQKTTREGA